MKRALGLRIGGRTGGFSGGVLGTALAEPAVEEGGGTASVMP
jgi:hypothetical protein